MKTSNSFEQQPSRRSRWEPMSTTNFAIMDELESQTSSTDSRCSPNFATKTNSLEDKASLKNNEDNFENNKNPNQFQFKTADFDYKIVENEEDEAFSMASTFVGASPRTFSNQQHKTSEKSQSVETEETLLDTSASSSKSESTFSFGKFKISNELSDQAIKLDSDMDNSFRRQSISARYIHIKLTLRIFYLPANNESNIFFLIFYKL